MLTTLLLLQAGYANVPYSSLESVIAQNKEAYYLALRQAQGTIRARKSCEDSVGGHQQARGGRHA